MAVLLKPGAVFLHIPKTGGSWVETALKRAGLFRFRVGHKHADLPHVLNYRHEYRWQYTKRVLRYGPGLQRDIAAAPKFCFVRHPLKWYASYHRFMKQEGWQQFGGVGNNPWHPNAPLYPLADDDFNTFIANVVEHAPGYLTGLYEDFAPSTGNLRGSNPGSSGHFPDTVKVGRQESLGDDLVRILGELDIAFDEAAIRGTGRVNVSRNTQDAAYTWDESLQRQLIEAERGAFDRFGYDA